MPTPLHLKPATAAWIASERRRLGLKPADVAQRLAAMGLEVSEATVKVWESNADRRPSPYNLEGLERLFGSKAPDAGASTGTDLTPLVGALERQTEAINALIARLDLLATSAVREGVEEALREAQGGRPAGRGARAGGGSQASLRPERSA